MLKKLASVVTIVLALNFLVAAGGVGALVATGKLDKSKVQEIRKLIVGDAESATTQPSTQPAQELPQETPLVRLQNLVAESSGRSNTEQVQVIQTAYDAQSAVLERRMREVEDQRRQLQQAKDDFEILRKKLLVEAEDLKKKQDEQGKLSGDKGFQDTLALYQSMPPKRVKDIFKTLDDEIVVRYLQSMEPRQAGSILKEFKTPEDTTRAQTILEKMRQATTQ